MKPLRQLRLSLLALAALVVIGTVGYKLLWNVTVLDGLYMTVITLATVGFRELKPPGPEAEVFTICLIVLGVISVAWAGRSIAEMALSEQFREYFGKRQVVKTIARLSGHTIICGFGRMGGQIAADLARAGKAFVVIDPNPEVLDRLRDSGYPYLAEDASSEAALKAAGIARATNLVTVAPSDADNVFIVLTAKGLNPNLFVVARSILLENENKLRHAGADRVISPYVMGGRRMAAAVLHPRSVGFLDVAMGGDFAEMELAGVEVSATSALAGSPLAHADLQDRYGVTVIAIKRGGIFGMAPGPETVLLPGDTLMIIGPSVQVEALRNL